MRKSQWDEDRQPEIGDRWRGAICHLGLGGNSETHTIGVVTICCKVQDQATLTGSDVNGNVHSHAAFFQFTVRRLGKVTAHWLFVRSRAVPKTLMNLRSKWAFNRIPVHFPAPPVLSIMNDRRGYSFPSDAGRSSQWPSSSPPPSRYPPPPNQYQNISNAYPTMASTTHSMASVHPAPIPYGMGDSPHVPSAGHHTGGYPAPVPNQYAPGVASNAYHQSRANYLPSSHHASPANPAPQYSVPSHQYPAQHIPSHPSNHHPSSSYYARDFQQPQYPASPTRPFSCDLCALSFNRQHDLKRHRETHSGEKPFFCNGGCGKTFTRKDALKRHQLVKHCGHEEDP